MLFTKLCQCTVDDGGKGNWFSIAEGQNIDPANFLDYCAGYLPEGAPITEAALLFLTIPVDSLKPMKDAYIGNFPNPLPKS